MSDQWYWQHRQDLLGPLTTAELEKLVLQLRVGDDDRIRAVGTDEWLTGAMIKEIFVAEMMGNVQTPAEAAMQHLTHPRYFRGTGQAATAPRSSILADIFGFCGDCLSYVTEWVAKGIVVVAEHLPNFWNRWVAFAVITTVVGSLALGRIDIDGGGKNRKHYKEFAKAIQLIKLKAVANSSDADWQQLRETLLPTIKSAKKSMEEVCVKYRYGKHALFDFETENAVARQALIQATYPLIEVLNSGQKFDTATLKAAELEMRHAEDVFSGKFISEYHASWSGQSTSSAPETVALTNGIIVFDVLLVIGAAMYFCRRQFVAA